MLIIIGRKDIMCNAWRKEARREPDCLSENLVGLCSSNYRRNYFSDNKLLNFLNRHIPIRFIFENNKECFGRCHKPYNQNDKINSSKLDSVDNGTSTSVLQADIQVSARNDGILGSKKASSTGSIATENNKSLEEGRINKLPTLILSPGTHIAPSYKIPLRRIIEFYIEADNPVTSYILDEAGLNDFYNGEEIPSYGGFANRREHHQELRLDFRGKFYLIIMNEKNKETAIHYEVYL